MTVETTDRGTLPDVPMVIGGERVEPKSWLDNIDPSYGEFLCRVASGTAGDINRAVQSAKSVAKEWAGQPPAVRGALLRALADRIRQEADALAVLETRDTGKPISQAKADIAACARYFEYYGSVIEAFVGHDIPLGPAFLALAERHPYGVTGHIVPWNYPAQITARSIAPALAVGNATVVKPAEIAPLTPVRLAELALEVGFPAGVLNVVPGEGPTAGAALTDHPDVALISFTGSVPTGRQVAQRCAARGRPCTLELGGKSPHVVLRGADLDRATPLIMQTLLQNAGQTCVAGTRALVHESLHGELIERLANGLAEMHIAPGLDDPDMGPLISAGQHARVRGFVERATAQGVDVVTNAQPPADLTGYFVPPIVFDNVNPASEIARDEVFGPVLAVTPFADEAEAVALANGTEYGLTAAVWSQDIDRALRVARQVEAGQVFVNGYAAGGGVELPFGGFKASGHGREKGLAALDEFTQTRTLVVKLADGE